MLKGNLINSCGSDNSFNHYGEKQGNRKLEMIFFILGALYILLGSNAVLGIYDESICLMGGYRILHGEVPYKDFWLLYAPGQCYLFALIFAIFGKSVMVIRLLAVCIIFLSSYYTYKISRLMFNIKSSLVVFSIAIIITNKFGLYFITAFVGTVILIIGLYYALLYLRDKGKPYYIYTSIIFGIISFFRHDFVAYTFIISLFYFFLLFYKADKVDWRVIRNYFALYFALIIAFYSILVYLCGFDNMYEQLIRIPAEIFPVYRAKSLSYNIFDGTVKESIKNILNLIFFFAPIIMSIISIIFVLTDYKKERASGEPTHNFIYLHKSILLLSITALVLLNQARIRNDEIHLLPSFLTIIIAVPYLLSKIKTGKARILVFAVCFLLLFGKIIQSKAKGVINSFGKNGYEFMQMENARYISEEKGWLIPFRDAVNYIKSITADDERIFVCNFRNDKIYVNDMLFYYLSDRLPAVKYHELHPGVATTAPIQNEIIESLEAHRTRYIVQFYNPIDAAEIESTFEGSKLLDEYIAYNFNLDKDYGSYRIMKRKN